MQRARRMKKKKEIENEMIKKILLLHPWCFLGRIEKRKVFLFLSFGRQRSDMRDKKIRSLL
jgi:hypothetical protein